MRIATQAKLKTLKKDYRAQLDKFPRKVLICCGPGCLANGAQKVSDEFKKVLKKKRIKGFSVEALKETGCHGFCEQGPLVVFEPDGTFYTKVKVKDVEEIVNKTIKNNEVVERLLYTDPKTDKKIKCYKDIPFYSHQTRIALRNIGKIRQCDIEEYIAVGGYQALAKALTKMTPQKVIKEVSDSGLRGRGGGGFPTGRKWATCAKIEETPHYVICNGDEGDPGAFMDRAIMEGDPHSVIEGIIIAAYAVGANDGYVYVREEYPLAVVNIQKAVEQAREKGFLGDNIFGSGFSFDIKVSRGGGAFVCGESSALMKSVAGEVGEPRAKYVRSVQKGLFDKPTVLNNVESYANVPVIIEKGAKWFAGIGTSKSTGTKAFSLVGKVRNSGLVEVPMGTSLRGIIYDIGGGLLDDRPFKAVQTGGPSGGCLPESKLDLPVDFDTLTEAGSMMGSGGMIVMDDRTCVVDVAKYFLSFLIAESCGKCVPCREGLYQLHALAVAISEGRATEEDLDKMEKLSETIVTASLCGLGKSGPNPFLSTIRYFRDEYMAHIREKRCPAGVCRALIRYEVITDKCDGCMACVPACAQGAITGKKNGPHIIDQDKCDQCGACFAVCKRDAIKVT
ncbi:MAG: NADH-ubiquinone oxidoreductase-F iron-sulfur binding region domain-containing protein [candidate division Zixibacteria bacterium]|nr:NADH-ubiquinone oxidoreductase-F iron-sulfur binding region domain-containing protein [candidate division Zixibacteria bacterium]